MVCILPGRLPQLWLGSFLSSVTPQLSWLRAYWAGRNLKDTTLGRVKLLTAPASSARLPSSHKKNRVVARPERGEEEGSMMIGHLLCGLIVGWLAAGASLLMGFSLETMFGIYVLSGSLGFALGVLWTREDRSSDDRVNRWSAFSDQAH